MRDGNEKIKNLELCSKSFFERFGVIQNKRNNEGSETPFEQVSTRIRESKPERFEDRTVQPLVQSTRKRTETFIINTGQLLILYSIN